MFALVPALCTCCFLVWWRRVLWRTRVHLGAKAGEPFGPRRAAKFAALFLVVGVLAPVGVLVLARGRTYRGRAPAIVADCAFHAYLSLLFLRSAAALRRQSEKRRRRVPARTRVDPSTKSRAQARGAIPPSYVEQVVLV